MLWVCPYLDVLFHPFSLGSHSGQAGEAKGGETASIGCCCCWRDSGEEETICSGSFQAVEVIYAMSPCLAGELANPPSLPLLACISSAGKSYIIFEIRLAE